MSEGLGWKSASGTCLKTASGCRYLEPFLVHDRHEKRIFTSTSAFSSLIYCGLGQSDATDVLWNA